MNKNRAYQRNFSEILPEAMFDSQRREKKAKTMVAVLNDYFRTDLKSFSVLDIGSSTGIIANYLSKYFGKVIGIDIDAPAIKYARDNFIKENLAFEMGDSMCAGCESVNTRNPSRIETGWRLLFCRRQSAKYQRAPL